VDNIKGDARPEDFGGLPDRGEKRFPNSFDSQVQTLPLVSAFTRRREVFTGRMAMLGFLAAFYWEWYFPSHPNILQKVSAFTARTGWQISAASVLSVVVAVVIWNTITALAPGSATYTRQNQADVAKRPPGPNQEVPKNPQQAFGIRGWGFTKANEVFVGRIAMLGFPAAIIGQLRMGGLDGPGPIAQVANIFGKVPDEAWYSAVGGYFSLFVIVTLAVAYIQGRPGTVQGEDDIY